MMAQPALTRAFQALTPAQAGLLLAIISLLNLLYALSLPVHPDEAYYWVWSRNLQLGYYDHPPLIAYLNRLAASIFGDNALAIRMVAVACMSGAAFYIYLTARAAFGNAAGSVALLLCLVLPAVTVAYAITTPDSPLVLFWAMALHHGLRAAALEGRTRDWLLCGLAAGLALLAKYTAVLFIAGLALFILLRRPRLLLSWKPWAGLALALLAFSPVIAWNAANGFESFLFQYHHGSSDSFAVRWGPFFEFLGGQFLIASPVIFVLMVWAALRPRAVWPSDSRLYLAILFLFPLCFFLWKGLFEKMQLNWAVPAIIAALPLVADFILQRGLKRTALAGFALALLISLVLRFPMAVGLTGEQNIHNRLFGFSEMVREVDRLRQPGDMIFADHLQRASILWLELEGQPRVRIPTQSRRSEYSRWDAGSDWSSMAGLYVSTNDRLNELQALFGHAELIRDFTAERPGFKSRHFLIYRVGRKE
ncbi:glycosyltransferase family 39 protein [Telmatospirillum sp. J64-1]|uniref:glycosyltransferase family 39 protein n=1 Tax=Telmatospirillum sp. J64-1 TaxID=2502183 RepID=UPI00163D96EB|nr:glycosyltransferase family 39 protein [Telmatospirillum sp. J64-1]